MKNTNCFTHDEAGKFLRELLEDVFPNGNPERLKDFYTPDLIGHFGEEIFYFADIINRIITLKETTNNCHFEVKNFIVTGDLIMFTCKQSWVAKADNSYSNLTIFGVYKILKGKICEAWLLYDAEGVHPYKDVNKNYAKNMLQFELNAKSKAEFLQHLKNAKKLYGIRVKLTPAEEECLYYYFHGFSAKETAIKMDLSYRTVETYLAQVKDKFACKTKAELRKKLFSDKS